ncbi:MAG: Maf family protein [Polyangiaceae bacterium]
MVSKSGAHRTNIVSIVLGSASPRRRELLEAQGFRLHVRPADVDEGVRENEAPQTYLERIVTDKLRAAKMHVGPGMRADALLVADTTVTIDARILGKPVDREESKSMIDALSGRAHDVMTRFSILALESGREHAETVLTRVIFRALAPEEIDAYVATGEGDDKAGAYAVQGKGAALVARIEGSYTNVVGLPIAEVVVALAMLGLSK